jgi:uncharacterized PurR-regulated membrane protein YhhQ (DUF165 family)
MLYVIMYLAAIVAANLSATTFGPNATIINAFLFIGLDLTARDKLHTAWRRKNLVLKMTTLIAAGSLLSYALNAGASQVALASFVAFAAGGVVDAVTFHALRDRHPLLRMNGSNVPAALVDSIVFPWLVFGGFLPLITLGQLAAKVAGGFVWSLLLRK